MQCLHRPRTLSSLRADQQLVKTVQSPSSYKWSWGTNIHPDRKFLEQLVQTGGMEPLPCQQWWSMEPEKMLRLEVELKGKQVRIKAYNLIMWSKRSMEEDRRHDKTSTISQSIRKLKQAASGNAFRHFPPMSEYSQGSPFCRLPRWVSGKESTCRCRRCVLDPWSQKTPWRRKWQPTPVFLPEFPLTEEPGGLQSTGSQESDMT